MTDFYTQEAPLTVLAPAKTSERTSISWRTIQRKVKAGDFPQPIRLSENRIGFLESEINAWIASIASARKAA